MSPRDARATRCVRTDSYFEALTILLQGTTLHLSPLTLNRRRSLSSRHTKMKTLLRFVAASLFVAFFSAIATIGASDTVTRKLYVANTSGDTLSVIDLDRQEVVREIQIGKHPHGLALSPDQRKIYCTIESERAIKFLDTATDEAVASVSTTGVPNQLAVTPDGNWL